MGAAPQGPGDDGGGLDLALRQARSHPADFLHRPADQRWLWRIIRRLLFGGAGMLALRRIAASIAKASMTRETCRCQPCQERVSLWSRPSSFLAVSKLSSIAQRRPSTVTSIVIGVPAGHQWRKRPGHHPRWCGGSAGLWSKDRTGSRCIRWPQDRPVHGQDSVFTQPFERAVHMHEGEPEMVTYLLLRHRQMKLVTVSNSRLYKPSAKIEHHSCNFLPP